MSDLGWLLVTASSEVEETNTEVLFSQAPWTQFTQYILVHLQEQQIDRVTGRQTNKWTKTERWVQWGTMDLVHPTHFYTCPSNKLTTKIIILDCDQSNVLFTCIIFTCILLRAFLFLSTCIRDPASTWDHTNIMLIVTGIEVIIKNWLPIYLAPSWRYDASKTMGSRPRPFGVTRRHQSCDHSTPGSWLPMEIWPFEVLPGRLFQEQRSIVGGSVSRRSVLNITLISYTPLHYVINVVRKE